MKIHKYILTVGLIISAGTLHGQSAADAIHITENEEGIGARALAMGGAYTALSNDYTGIYWNPAGLAGINENTIYAELSHLQFSNDALYAGNLTSNNQGFTKLKSLGFAMPLPTSHGSLVIAGGYNRVLDYDDHLFFEGFSEASNDLGFEIDVDSIDTYFYPFDSDVNRQEDILTEGGLSQWSVGAAIALSPNFTVGLTTALVHGEEEYNFNFSQFDDDDIYNEFPADFDEYTVNQYLLSEYYAFHLKLGGIATINELLKIGGAITFPTTYYVEETHSFDDNLYFDDGSDDPTDDSGTYEYNVKTPFIFDAGLAFSNKLITLSAATRYRDWSQTRFETSDYEDRDRNNNEFGEENRILTREYDQVVEYRFGGEILLPGFNTKLRAGYKFVPSALANSDDDRSTYSAGIGFKVDRNVNLDITFMRSDWTRESSDTYTPAGTEESIETNRILIGLTYNL